MKKSKIILASSVLALGLVGGGIFMQQQAAKKIETTIEKNIKMSSAIKSHGKISCKADFLSRAMSNNTETAQCTIKDVKIIPENSKDEITIGTVGVSDPIKFAISRQMTTKGVLKPNYQGSYKISLEDIKVNGTPVSDYIFKNDESLKRKYGEEKAKEIEALIHKGFAGKTSLYITDSVKTDKDGNADFKDQISLKIGKSNFETRFNVSVTADSLKLLGKKYDNELQQKAERNKMLQGMVFNSVQFGYKYPEKDYIKSFAEITQGKEQLKQEINKIKEAQKTKELSPLAIKAGKKIIDIMEGNTSSFEIKIENKPKDSVNVVSQKLMFSVMSKSFDQFKDYNIEIK